MSILLNREVGSISFSSNSLRMFKIDDHIKVCFKSYASLTSPQDVFIDQRFFFGCKHLINMDGLSGTCVIGM